MDLKEFVSATLVQIMEGVTDAQEKTKGSGGRIVPRRESEASIVKFDVAVFAKEEAAGGAKAGLSVLGVKAGVGGSTGASKEATNRVQFGVPCRLPMN